MAIYEYDCARCGARLEVMQPMSSQPLEVCGSECVQASQDGTGKVTRVLSLPWVAGAAAAAAPAPSRSCGSCGRFGPDVCA